MVPSFGVQQLCNRCNAQTLIDAYHCCTARYFAQTVTAVTGAGTYPILWH